VYSGSASDHCVLVLKDMSADWGPKPFRSLDVSKVMVGSVSLYAISGLSMRCMVEGCLFERKSGKC